MMKIVKDALGVVVAYGPNDDNYVPEVDPGNTLELMDDAIAAPLIAQMMAKLAAG